MSDTCEDVHRQPSAGPPNPHDRQTEADGAPLLSGQRIVCFVLTAFFCGTAIACWLEAARLESFAGRLDAESVAVRAQWDGRIERLLVHAGDVVDVGAPLLEATDQTLVDAIVAARSEIESLRTELTRAEARAEVELAWRTRTVGEEEFRAQLQAASYLKHQFFSDVENLAWGDFATLPERKVSTTEPEDVFRFAAYPSKTSEDLERLQALLRQEAAQNEAEVSGAQLELCEARLKALKQLKVDLPEKVRRAEGVDQLRSQLAEATKRLDDLQSRETDRILTAPAYGTVGAIQAREGNHVTAEEPLLKLLDEDQRFVIVRFPTHRLPEIAPGMLVDVSFPGSQLFRGRIEPVPPQTDLCGSDDRNAPSDQAFVSLRISPAGRLWPDAPIGTAVEVHLADQ